MALRTLGLRPPRSAVTEAELMTANDIARGRELVESGKYRSAANGAVILHAEPPADVDDHHAGQWSPTGDREAETAHQDAINENAYDGAEFIFGGQDHVEAIWGKDNQVLWASGEALMIAGPQGVGKTTLAGLILSALLGLTDAVLGLPFAEFSGRILYLAMDRPNQIKRSLRRQFAPIDSDTLQARLTVKRGPPPADLAAQPLLLAALAERYDADVVIVDSLKDAAIGLKEDDVAASYNRARQHLLSQGRELLELHHTVKRRGQQDQPPTVDDIYGSTWLTSGCGSIVMVWGEPGDPIVQFRHIKQPADEVGPYRLLHDQDNGLLSIEHGADLLALVKAKGVDGLTAKDAAAAMFDKPRPGRAETEKARRKLDRLVQDTVLARVEGSKGGGEGGVAVAYFLAERTDHGRSRFQEKPQVRGDHGLFETETDHAPITPITRNNKTAGQSDHGTDHADHTPSDHAHTAPRRGAGDRAPQRRPNRAGDNE